MHYGLDEIMRDIRAAHAKDTDNVPDNSVADMIRKNLEDYQREIRPESPEHKEENLRKGSCGSGCGNYNLQSQAPQGQSTESDRPYQIAYGKRCFGDGDYDET